MKGAKETALVDPRRDLPSESPQDPAPGRHVLFGDRGVSVLQEGSRNHGEMKCVSPCP
jgi:hypothetical protein